MSHVVIALMKMGETDLDCQAKVSEGELGFASSLCDGIEVGRFEGSGSVLVDSRLLKRAYCLTADQILSLPA